MDIKNINIWKEQCCEKEDCSKNRVESTRLSQFEEQGYRIKKYEADYIIVERKKSTRSVICESIDDAEIIVNLAIALESNTPIEIVPKPRQYIIDKAELLVGK